MTAFKDSLVCLNCCSIVPASLLGDRAFPPNAIMTVYKALNKSNQKKFTKLPLRKMVDVTWKLVK